MAAQRINNPFLTEEDWVWIALAENVRLLSKDPNRKVGCVLVKDGVLVSSGFNKLPLNSTFQNSFRLSDPLTKNLSIIHAEMAAINVAASEGLSVKGCTAFITCHPCSTCASILIDVGIERVICPGFQSYKGKWSDSFKLASDDMYQSGIRVLYYGELP